MKLLKALWVLLVLAALVLVAGNGVKALEGPKEAASEAFFVLPAAMNFNYNYYVLKFALPDLVPGLHQRAVFYGDPWSGFKWTGLDFAGRHSVGDWQLSSRGRIYGLLWGFAEVGALFGGGLEVGAGGYYRMEDPRRPLYGYAKLALTDGGIAASARLNLAPMMSVAYWLEPRTPAKLASSIELEVEYPISWGLTPAEGFLRFWSMTAPSCLLQCATVLLELGARF